MQTFSEYLAVRHPEMLDEGFWDSFKQSAKSAYQSARGNPENDQDLQKYASQAVPALQKAGGVAKQYADKLGISLPLATALIASGMIGGPAAMPFAALMYFVRKPVNKISGAAFDYGAQKLGLMPKPQAQPAQAQPVSQAGPRPSIQDLAARLKNRTPAVQTSWNTSFNDYVAIRETTELDEGLGDFMGSMLGKAAGFIGGKATKYTMNVANMLKSSAGALLNFARENKLGIAKAAFMMAVGALVGAGVGAAVNKVSAAMDSVANSGVAPEQEIAALKQQVIGQESVTSPDAADYINPAPGNSITSPDAASYVNGHSTSIPPKADDFLQNSPPTSNDFLHGSDAAHHASNVSQAAKSGVDLDSINASNAYAWKQQAKQAFIDAHKDDPQYSSVMAQKMGMLRRAAEKFADREGLIKFGQQMTNSDGSTTYYMGSDPKNFSRLTIRP
jgi:hypothetical protein